mgnify:FL=1
MNNWIQHMESRPKISRYQVMSSMTSEELLSEGYASYDDFYDPEEEQEQEKQLISETSSSEVTEKEKRISKTSSDETVEEIF